MDTQTRRNATAANQSARIRAQRSNDDEQEDAAFKQALEDSKDSAVSVEIFMNQHAAAVQSSITPKDPGWYASNKAHVTRFIQGALQKLKFDSYKENFGDFHVNPVKVGVDLGILPRDRSGPTNWRGVTSTWQLWLKKYLAHHNPVADPADVADDIPAAPAAADDAPAAPAAAADAPAAPDDAPDAVLRL